MIWLWLAMPMSVLGCGPTSGFGGSYGSVIPPPPPPIYTNDYSYSGYRSPAYSPYALKEGEVKAAVEATNEPALKEKQESLKTSRKARVLQNRTRKELKSSRTEQVIRIVYRGMYGFQYQEPRRRQAVSDAMECLRRKGIPARVVNYGLHCNTFALDVGTEAGLGTVRNAFGRNIIFDASVVPALNARGNRMLARPSHLDDVYGGLLRLYALLQKPEPIARPQTILGYDICDKPVSLMRQFGVKSLAGLKFPG